MKLKAFIIILFLIPFVSCKGQVNKSIEDIQTPESFKVLEEIEGDLNNDGIPEKVVVYDTEKETDYGTERQIHIYKKNNNEWGLWKKSIGVILPSQQGGMMGDPFDGISIERNCIVINHFGGSRQKWNYTHRFRHQNGDFQLIGATISYGAPCDYVTDFDYNLSNGKIHYKKEAEDCENENSTVEKENMTRKLEVLPTMDSFQPGNNEIKMAESGTVIYY